MSVNEEKDAITGLFLPSLAMSQIATSSLSILIGLFLVGLEHAFQVPVGIIGQRWSKRKDSWKAA